MVYAELQTNISILMTLKNGRKNTKQVEPHYYGPSSKKKAKIIIRKIHQSTEAYSALYQTIMKELFYENKSIIKKDYFCKEASLEMFDRVLNTP